MDQKTFKKDEFVIKEGDDGDELYVVDKGQLRCTKLVKNTEEQKFILDYHEGMAFGELALLYNAPRAASIQALEECELFTLDRSTFNNIVKDAVIKKRQYYHDFLGQVELLDTLDDMEKDKLCDCLKEEKFKKDDYVIK